MFYSHPWSPLKILQYKEKYKIPEKGECEKPIIFKEDNGMSSC